MSKEFKISLDTRLGDICSYVRDYANPNIFDHLQMRIDSDGDVDLVVNDDLDVMTNDGCYYLTIEEKEEKKYFNLLKALKYLEPNEHQELKDRLTEIKEKISVLENLL